MAIDLRKHLRQLRKGLELPPGQLDTTRIAPVFVPAAFFAAGNWCGPHARLRAPEIGLTWAVLLPDQTMRYVDFGMKEHWDALGLDWKALALQNLAEHSGDTLGTHALRRSNGEVYGVGLMHPDGIGPSRLLLRDQLARLFPGGYQVALPEMSCAFAFSVELERNEMATVQQLVADCFQKGTRPLAPGIHAPEDLLPGMDRS
jgi:hypothetical protein